LAPRPIDIGHGSGVLSDVYLTISRSVFHAQLSHFGDNDGSTVPDLLA
jgi:hypothetical protein